mgnify:CR=1 FL=1
MTNRERHLDRLAAYHAQEIVRRADRGQAADMDNTVTKALGVLQENGIYACALFLKSRSGDEKKRADIVMDEMLKLLDEGFGWGKPPSTEAKDILHHISNLVARNSLERLLLAKETLEQMLIYARYGAKARKEEEK